MNREQCKLALDSFERTRTIGDLTIKLPEPPKWNEIDGYNLHKASQKFQYTEQPKRNEEPSDEFLEQEANRFESGYFFYNNGNLEWITGNHYFILNYWKDRGKRLVFIDAQRDFFIWWWSITVNKNIAIGILITNRRFGKTVCGTGILYMRTATKIFQYAGIQSKTNADGKGVFNKMVSSWTTLPDWLKPVDSGETRPATALEFYEPRRRSSKDATKLYSEALNSKIDFKSSEELAYDGEELDTYFGDEEGKCHTKGTQVLMFDGSYRNVEDIRVGDWLMGNDSTKRIVNSLANGYEKCYNVIPKAKGWYHWGCNESHILSLKFCGSYDRKFQKNQTYNFSIKEFLSLTKKQQKHFCLYKEQVNYEHKETKIDPYFLGVWLGDGHSRAVAITNIDPEIKKFFYDIAQKENLNVRISGEISYHLAKHKGNKGNRLLDAFRFYKLIENKHIPSDYLFNSREVRLKLLAGLIDTDGSKSATKDCYEITQKNKLLSFDIQRLCSELGFKSNLKEKTATMKRADGSIYICQVYRIQIYGLNLHEVPCLIERKKCVKKEIKHKNTRDSLKTCLSLEDIGIQEYFGFSISGNHLYMLKDTTVTHNTIGSNVKDRQDVVVKCLMKGPTIKGKALKTTTVEEMDKKGGKNFKLIWDAAAANLISSETGRNASLSTRLFIPADFGYLGEHPITGVKFVDEYGISNREAAKEYILSTWKGLEGNDLASAQRKDPLTIKHVWQLKNFGGCFDNEVLEIQKDYLERTNDREEDNAPKNLIRRVTFYREYQKADNPMEDPRMVVKWRDDPKGHCEMIWDFNDSKQANKKKPGPGGSWAPANEESFAIGVDPVGATMTTGTEKSQAVAFVYRKGDINDPENSGMLILRFAPVQRMRFKADFHKYVMMLCEYYGCKANYESNIDDYYEKFIEEGFKNYIMWRPKSTIDPQRKNVKTKYGTPSNDPFALQKQTDIADEYIKTRYHKIYFAELVRQLIAFDPDDRTKYDDCIAFFMALIGGTERKTDNKPKINGLSIVPVLRNVS